MVFHNPQNTASTHDVNLMKWCKFTPSGYVMYAFLSLRHDLQNIKHRISNVQVIQPKIYEKKIFNY